MDNITPELLSLSDADPIVDQKVVEPTHIGGAILDHVYIHLSLMETFIVDVSVKSVFFTDHDAINIVLSNI